MSSKFKMFYPLAFTSLTCSPNFFLKRCIFFSHKTLASSCLPRHKIHRNHYLEDKTFFFFKKNSSLAAKLSFYYIHSSKSLANLKGVVVKTHFVDKKRRENSEYYVKSHDKKFKCTNFKIKRNLGKPRSLLASKGWNCEMYFLN